MKFGVTIPNNWGIEDPQHVLALGPVAEELGYDSLWVMDHLFNNGYIRERLDAKPYYHPLATPSYLALRYGLGRAMASALEEALGDRVSDFGAVP